MKLYECDAGHLFDAKPTRSEGCCPLCPEDAPLRITTANPRWVAHNIMRPRVRVLELETERNELQLKVEKLEADLTALCASHDAVLARAEEAEAQVQALAAQRGAA